MPNRKWKPKQIANPLDFTPHQAADYSKTTLKNIYRMLEDGFFRKAYKIGREWRIPKSELESTKMKNRHVGRPKKRSKKVN